jgi:hypothetical protein
MPDQRPQSYSSHTRFHPIWHFVAFPIVAINFLVQTKVALGEPTGHNLWSAVAALGVVLAVFAARGETLTVQNRVIRLEMRLRLKGLLSPEMAARIPELTVSQLVGLRFASDEELPALVERALKGELPDAKSCKQAVKNWQADWLRA